MPTDRARRTVEIEAPYDRVLATVRDVASQAEWVPEIRTAEVLETDGDGLPVTARFTAASPVGTDGYTLTYAHRPDGLSWSLVTGRLQSGQDGRYELRKVSARRTEVTFELVITHGLPLPGFVRRRVIGGLVDSTLGGLTAHLEGAASGSGRG